ncbi:class I SAM-dependent DNA methyltransferase [Leptospira yanagawae]|uniref:site-specific DNA-methyltransferase (adenine-specific) n=1 Tax=Leptospira yanagawae TaxID=293069 RepID=A0ABY2LZF4_9LEPT|nr:TaqI-like C-terminal specificity domain-containing protein [Leptospira yanagawae]TGL17919.1 class I SAM-dependent DNA methyltransferase [Leptospira yanagawae]
MILNLKKLTPRKALNKAFLKIKPIRSEMDKFKQNLINLLDRIDDKEREEFHKNLVIDFLKKSFFDPDYFINTKGSNDLVIHNGDSAKSSVGVIIEVKKPLNKSEMVSTENLNVKAMHELILYFLRERVSNKNLELKHLIITNIYEWFIFDLPIFEKLFIQNKEFQRKFIEFDDGRLSGNTTDFFYNEIANPYLKSINQEIEFTYFNFKDFEKPLRNSKKEDDNLLIPLYKIFSREHLLKLPFANDSNTLDKRFYSELLHIIGLSESKEGGKKLIGRNKPKEQHTGSILEDTIIQLESLDKIKRIDKPNQFGDNFGERIFNVALELSITWINRILFLKLLEAQLSTYHKSDKTYAFLSIEKIKNYDDLNSLFFQVLAVKHDKRNADVKKQFSKVPYLNSSLFEPTELEQITLFISNLKDDKTIPISSQTILKDKLGRKRTGKIKTLEYLFDFLNAYDFSSEGSEDIQEDNKSLINASVLGLIFEKINGYKDGSFFTPGFITMHMCRETIRKAVLQKFNDIKSWNCQNFSDLYNKIDDRKEANDIINSIKICDPAVGSGHFLVSALNEIIAVKNDLKILQDREGKRLKEYHIEVANDELVVTDEEGDLFEYHPSNNESQRIQETLFHEKQIIIENCLFGVDINPNSVKICRLRLWIELLKNAYYKNSTELETLPNIDINIKCGNSLVSKYPLTLDIKSLLKKRKWTIDEYKGAVRSYQNAISKTEKFKLEKFIQSIKSEMVADLSDLHPDVVSLRKIKQLLSQESMFELQKKEIEKFEKWRKEKNALELKIKSIEENKIYENAFEWRFEFPEVLNNEGDFIGFDVIIGNPPYLTYHGRRRELISNEMIAYLKNNYNTIDDKSGTGKYNSVMFFIEKSFQLGKSNSINTFIIDISFYEGFYKKTRDLILKNSSVLEVVNGLKDFEDVGSGQLILSYQKTLNPNHIVKYRESGLLDRIEYIPQIEWISTDQNFKKLKSNKLQEILSKIESDTKTLNDLFPEKLVRTGESVGVKESGFVCETREINSKSKIYPYVEGSKSLPFKYSKIKPTRFFIFDIDLLNKKNSAYRKKADENGRKNAKVLGIGDELAFKNPKVLIRQSCEYLCASYSEEQFVYNRSFYSISNINSSGESKFSLKYTLGLINSKLLNYYALNKPIIKNDEGKQPQIRLGDLKNLPIKIADNRLLIKIEKLVDKILDLKFREDSSEAITYEKQIDELVYKLYNLTEEEIEFVNNGLE